MITIEKLNSFGADTAEGLGRCYGNEALYLRLVNMIPAEGNFAVLEEALGAGDLDKAFEAAHALKGVLGNLSLTPLFTPVAELTEKLRGAQDTSGAGELPERIADQLAKLKALAE